MENKSSLTTGNVWKTLLKFAVPVLLANILQVIYGAADMWVVGQFATTADVSAVSVSSQPMTTVTLVVSGLTTGASVLLGQYCGAGNEKGMRETTGTSIAFFAIVAAVIMVPLIIFNNAIISIMNTPAAAVIPARQYLFICAIGIFFIIGYNLVSCIMRGMGDSKTPLLFVAVSAIINIVVDVILVKCLSMGAAGAAIATVGAQAGSMIFAILFLRRKGLGFKFSAGDIRLNGHIIKSIFKIGTPLSLQELLVSLSFVFIIYVVNGIGLAESAAVGIVEKVMTFLAMPTFAMQSAVATMSSHNIGARQFSRARRSLFSGICISLIIAVAATLLTIFWGSGLVGLFSIDSEVIRVGSMYIKAYGIDCMMMAVVFNFNGYFSSCNHATFSMAHSLFATLCVRVPCVYLFSRMADATLFTIGLAMPMSSFVSIILCIVYLIWITHKENPEKMVVTE